MPCNDKVEFKKLFDGCTQDILLILYLSNLIRSHVSLAEKLATFALPLACHRMLRQADSFAW